MFSVLQKRLYWKWKTYAPERWWGDFIDIRFYLVDQLSKLRGKKIFDIGCNAGIIASELAANGKEEVGMDIEIKSLKSYIKLFKHLDLVPKVVNGSWDNPMFKDNYFDVLLFSWTLYYGENDENKSKIVSRLTRALKPGGSIYFVEANRYCFIQGRGKEHFWTVDMATSFFSSHGFEVKEVLGWNPLPSLLFWLPWKIKNSIPQKVVLFFYPPGRLVQYAPGWYSFFKWLGKFRMPRRYCRSYYIRADKKCG